MPVQAGRNVSTPRSFGFCSQPSCVSRQLGSEQLHGSSAPHCLPSQPIRPLQLQHPTHTILLSYQLGSLCSSGGIRRSKGRGYEPRQERRTTFHAQHISSSSLRFEPKRIRGQWLLQEHGLSTLCTGSFGAYCPIRYDNTRQRGRVQLSHSCSSGQTPYRDPW